MDRDTIQFNKCTLLQKKQTNTTSHLINSIPLQANAVDSNITFQPHNQDLVSRAFVKSHFVSGGHSPANKTFMHFTVVTAMMFLGRC